LRFDENLQLRRLNFKRLRAHLTEYPELRVLDATEGPAVNSHYCLSVVLRGRLQNSRDDIVRKLQERGVGTSVYYPHPVPRLSYYRNKYGYCPEAFPEAAAISDRSVALPVGPHLDRSDVDYIGETFLEIIKEIQP